MQNVADKIYEYLATYGLQILAAIAIFVIGRWLAKLIAKLVAGAMTRAKAEKTLITFVENVTYVVLMVTVVVAALAKLGVPTAQYVAVLGAMGLAIGLALQGSLSNFAAGILLIMFKPFKVGDFVELAGNAGTVEQIHLFTTVLNSPDNVRMIIPNSQVTGAKISNYTANESRRVDLKIGVSYGDDIKKAKQVIESVLNADVRILKNPAPTVAVFELGDSSVNFVVRPWVKPVDYWNVYFDVVGKIKLALEANGLTIPFPQRDINIKTSGLKLSTGA